MSKSIIEAAALKLNRKVECLKGTSEEVYTYLTDTEAATILGTFEDNKFAKDLVAALRQYRSWTPGRRFWAHKLVIDRLLGAKPAERPVVKLADLSGLMSIFRNALASGLAKPEITFALDDGSLLVLTIAGCKSKRPGTVNVTNGRPYGASDNRWFGRIDPETCLFERSRDCSDEIAGWLRKFSESPAELAASYGRKTGHCCFCGDKLTRAKGTGQRCKALYSVDVGYGPKCAKRYGLPYGLAASCE